MLAVVVVVFMVMRSGKSDTPVAQNVQPIQQVRMQDPPLVTKKSPEPKSEPDNKDKAAEPGPSATVEVASGIDHGQLVYKHVLKSAAWILVKKGEQASMGSGTLVDRKNRLVLTNHHVAGEADSDLLVFFPVYRDGKPISEREVHLKQTRREDLISSKARSRFLSKASSLQ